jgi:tetratricopeptide (TPR) repeat protein
MTKYEGALAMLLAATLSAVPAHAKEEPRYAPPASWVVGADKPVPPGKPGRGKIFLLNDVQSLVDAGRREIFSDTAYQVTSAELLNQLGTVFFAWQPDREDLVVHRLHIVRDGAVIDLLAGDKRLTVLRREHQLEQNAIDGILTATMAIDGLRVGDTVRFSSTHVQSNPTLPEHAEALQFLPPVEAQTATSTIRMMWPETLPMRWRTTGEKVAVQERAIGGMREISIAVPIAKQSEKPEGAPPRFVLPPQIELSSIAAWADLSRRHAAAYATDASIAAGSPLAQERDRIAKAGADPVARMTAAVQLVQREVRYLYNGLGTGNYDPQSPAETWQLRAGDCKAKTKLLLALLRDLGISAEAVLVHSEQGDALPQRLPAMAVFDHVIVRAQVNGTDYWLDGTSSGAEADTILDVPPFRFGLPLVVGGSDLVSLPERIPSRPETEIELSYDQSYGIPYPPLVTARLTLRGQTAEILKMADGRATAEQMDEMVQSVLFDMIGGGSVISHKLDVTSTAGAVVLDARALGNMQWDRSEGAPFHVIGGPIAGFSFSPDRSRAAWKDIPTIRPAMHNSVVRHYKLPDYGSRFSIEGAESLSADVAGIKVDRQTSRSDGVITVRETQRSAAGEIAPPAFAAARAAAARVTERPVRFKASAGYLSRWQDIVATRDGKALAPLIAAYQALIDKNPDEANSFANRAAFYRGIFRDELALADYSKALAIEDDPDTRHYRAATYSRLGKLDEALADVEQALEGKPGDANLIDSQVETLRRLGRHDDALAIVEDRVAQGGEDKLRWLGLKSEVLGFAGRGDDAIVVADEGVNDAPDSSDALNLRCWMKGLLDRDNANALVDCDRAIALANEPTEALDSRAMVHFRAGRLAEALADYDAVLTREPGHSASLFMRAIVYTRLGRKAEAARDLGGARMLDPWIERDMAAWGIKP